MKNKLNRGELMLAIGFFIGVFSFLLAMYFNNGYLGLGILAAFIIVSIGQVLAFKDFFKDYFNK